MNTNQQIVRQWEEQEALHRFQLISPLLREDLDNAKKLQLRKKIAEENEITVRSLYRYEKAYQTVKLFPCQAWDPREIRTHPEWKK